MIFDVMLPEFPAGSAAGTLGASGGAAPLPVALGLLVVGGALIVALL